MKLNDVLENAVEIASTTESQRFLDSHVHVPLAGMRHLETTTAREALYVAVPHIPAQVECPYPCPY